MKEIIEIWQKTTGVVLISLCAALYAAVLIPFKPIVIIPGFTELRPAIVLPIIYSFMFGPVAPWAAAFGNLIGDFFGTLGLGSFFGFFGNFLYGLAPYRVWQAFGEEELIPFTVKRFMILTLGILLASASCALLIGWGVDMLGLVPFPALAITIFVNNTLLSTLLSPFLLHLLYRRMKGLGILYIAKKKGRRYKFLIIFLLFFTLSGLILGSILSLKREEITGLVLPFCLSCLLLLI